MTRAPEEAPSLEIDDAKGRRKAGRAQFLKSPPSSGGGPRTAGNLSRSQRGRPALRADVGLDRLLIVGTSWQRGGIESLTRFTLPEEERAERLAALAADLGASELIYVATCNRVEVAFKNDDAMPSADACQTVFEGLTGIEPAPGDVERAFAFWTGEAAVEHVFRVASGLDSAQVGEREILGQIREAASEAAAQGLSGPLLAEVFGEALRVARLVHRRTAVGAGRLSLAEIGLDYLRARLRERTPAELAVAGCGRVALVGVSTMTRRCAQSLAEEGVELWIVNRTLEKAVQLADELGAQACSLDEFRRQPPALDAVLLATSSTQPVLGRVELERLVAASHQSSSSCGPESSSESTSEGGSEGGSDRGPVIVDMAVPPDVDPGTARAVGVARVGMAEITAVAEACREQRLEEAAPALELVRKGVAGLKRRRAERLLSPVIQRLSERYRQTSLEGLERFLQQDLSELDDAQRASIESWAAALSQRLAQMPIVGLRALASELGADAVRAFLAADDELLHEYQAATDTASVPESLHVVRSTGTSKE